MKAPRSILSALLACAVLAVAGLPQAAHAAAYRGDISILQTAKDGAVPGRYHLPSSVDTIIWGRLPNRNTQPVMTVPSGVVVTIDTVSHEGILEDQGKDPRAYFAKHGIAPDQVLDEAAAIAASTHQHDFDKDGPHVVTGPIAVEGAMPGDVLKVEVLSLEPRVPYGVISNRHYKGALVGEFPEGTERSDDANPLQPDRYGNVSVFTPVKKIDDKWYGFLDAGNGRELTFPLSPFLGIMGVTPDTDENWSSVPPARIGGNIDINELGVGSTLYLPVEVAGALFYTGDPHFVQGDGEVALTALEGSLRGTLRLTVLKQGSVEIPKTNSDNLVSPFGETEKFWIPVGLDEDLDEAMKKSVRESISFLAKQFGLDRRLVYAYLSAAVDYEVSQVVDKTKGIHALIPKADFAELIDVKLMAGGVNYDVALLNSVFHIPAAAVCGSLGIAYTESGENITVCAPSGTVTMRIDSNKYMVNGEATYLPVSPVAGNGGACMPVMVLSEILGVAVNWSTIGTLIQGNAVVL
ncbi:MAG: acetamidase/formamidase family protein [Planctomycetaceae bacterium]|nr:acetamidase/formamidase family protein [Planctomycetaceae bacterium]